MGTSIEGKSSKDYQVSNSLSIAHFDAVTTQLGTAHHLAIADPASSDSQQTKSTDPRRRGPLVLKRGFVELMARSNFSFLQGASHPEEMVEEAIRLHYKGIAICDLNGLYGVVRGYQIANSPSLFAASVEAKPDFHFIVGAELTLTDETSINFIPMNMKGYSNLCQLLTLGKRDVAKYFSKVTLAQIAQHHEGLIVFPLPPIKEERFLELRQIFGDRLYVPVWRDLTWESLEYCKTAFELEQKHDAQLFVTQRPLMHSSERKPVFDLLTCIHHHTTLEKADHILIQNGERHLRPLADLAYLWRDRLDLLDAPIDIASRVDFKMDQIRYRYPSSKLPVGQTPTTHLRELVNQGVQWRFPHGVPAPVLAMIDKELKLIAELEYEDYFLTLYEICQFASHQGILYQGRGSAANSVVCYCIGLTSVDPTKVDLLFERFISAERGEPPDIDIDFEHSRREEVIQYIYKTYDEEHAAMVCTVIRYRARMSIRETAKALDIPLKIINAMIKFMGRDGMRRLYDTEDLWQKLKIEEWKWKSLLTLAKQIYGYPRHIGIHTGGFLITHDPITTIVPVEKATMEGRYVIQWNKDDVNDLKLMKIDVLALGMLTALRRCLVTLGQSKGLNLNLAQIPPDDQQTYDMICRSETVGVFQIESRAQMNTLPRLRPRNYYDLVVEVALIRPGPLQGGMVHPYLRRRAGLEKVEYFHPDLKPVLGKTLGVPIFQEQVMKIAVVAAGFSPGEADELRRVMSAAWRRKGTMEGIRDRIYRGMLEKGIPEINAEKIYKTIEGFASYGFPESHAASFALLTYASCWFKCHHPDIFACSLLNSQPMGFYPPRVIIAEAQRNSVEFLPVDIQQSEVEYLLVGQAQPHQLLPVRAGLMSLYGVPTEIFKELVEERKCRGLFKSLQDLIQRVKVETRHGRVPIPRAVLLKLAAAGAMQSFGLEPRKLLWEIESLSLDPQSFLWGLPKENFNGDADEILPFESNWDRMAREYNSMGYSVDSHPMGILRTSIHLRNEDLKRQGFVPFAHSEDLKNIRSGRKVRVAGLVSVTQRPPTAKGMCFITLEDEFGFMNIVIPPDIYQKDRLTIYSRVLMEVHGSVEKNGVIINIKADRVFPLQTPLHATTAIPEKTITRFGY